MAFAVEFSDVCTMIVVWTPKTGYDRFGKPAYGSPQTFAPPTGGYRVFRNKRVVSGAGGQAADIISPSQIWLMATPAINLDDQVYVSGDTIFPPIVAVNKYADESGLSQFLEIMFGSFLG